MIFNLDYGFLLRFIMNNGSGADTEIDRKQNVLIYDVPD